MGSTNKKINDKLCQLCKIKLDNFKPNQIDLINQNSIKLMFGEIDSYRFRPASRENCPLCGSTLKERLGDMRQEMKE